jgi:hypothetical protein
MAGVIAEPAIGRVLIAAADIRRRPERTLVWETLSNGDSAFGQDTIFVPPGADAQLVFNDGTTLDLAENSLVVVEAQAGPRVRLAQGGLVARHVPRALAIDTASGTTTFEAESTAKLALHGDAARLDVFTGQAHAGADAVVGGEARELAHETTTAAAAWPAQLLGPERNARVFVTGAPPSLLLQWANGQAARVQVATGEDFAQIVLDAPAVKNATTFTAAAPGIYYWRLVGGRGEPLSETRRVSLIADKPPEPLRPAEHEIVGALPSHVLAFTWTPAAGAQRYRIEISARADFSTLIAEAKSETSVLYLERELGEGTYYWRVRVDPSERPSAPYSRTLAFRLVSKPVLEAPKLLGAEVRVGH